VLTKASRMSVARETSAAEMLTLRRPCGIEHGMATDVFGMNLAVTRNDRLCAEIETSTLCCSTSHAKHRTSLDP